MKHAVLLQFVIMRSVCINVFLGKKSGQNSCSVFIQALRKWKIKSIKSIKAMSKGVCTEIPVFASM